MGSRLGTWFSQAGYGCSFGMAVHADCEKGKCSKPWYVLSQTATAKQDCPEFLHLAATVSV